ncbi:hypothetical protein F5H01DRAFT_14514 [Linnemannia elongata]|nr:hypothetical protein F5H01DRAFT_14514 [Linnemannia elongata]
MSALLLLSRFYLCSYLLPTWLATTNSPFVLPQSCHLTLVISLDKKKKKKRNNLLQQLVLFSKHLHTFTPPSSHGIPLLPTPFSLPSRFFPCLLVPLFPCFPFPSPSLAPLFSSSFSGPFPCLLRGDNTSDT